MLCGEEQAGRRHAVHCWLERAPPLVLPPVAAAPLPPPPPPAVATSDTAMSNKETAAAVGSGSATTAAPAKRTIPVRQYLWTAVDLIPANLMDEFVEYLERCSEHKDWRTRAVSCVDILTQHQPAL